MERTGEEKSMKKILCLLLCLVLALIASAAAEEPEPQAEYAFSGKVQRRYDSESLKYTVERFKIDGTLCYLSKIWVQDPARQIRKATADWKKNIKRPVHIVENMPEAALVINGSGYVSPMYPWIPENYPGVSKDYHYTPLGSLTVTNGEIFRNLEGVSYYGLTLEEDGLHMYIDAENETVLARNPTETWSFYIECPMLLNNEDILPEEWPFADQRARRTVIARVNRNNYLILTVTNEGRIGLTLRQVSRFFREHFDTEWVYDLDGGPSSVLMCRAKGRKTLVTLMGGKAKDADVMAFTELP